MALAVEPEREPSSASMPLPASVAGVDVPLATLEMLEDEYGAVVTEVGGSRT